MNFFLIIYEVYSLIFFIWYVYKWNRVLTQIRVLLNAFEQTNLDLKLILILKQLWHINHLKLKKGNSLTWYIIVVLIHYAKIRQHDAISFFYSLL